MFRRSILPLLVLTVVGPRSAFGECTEPGKSRWGAKSNIPKPSSIVHANFVSLADLLAMPDAKVKKFQPTTGLIAPFPNPHNLKEGDMVKTRGCFRLVATEDNDCEYHMQLTRTKSSKPSFSVEVAKDDATSIPEP
jgi:hypothetical protein